ncbi:hypothetical protein DMENIID0001_023590 [Sergentomyia squamirostris]
MNSTDSSVNQLIRLGQKKNRAPHLFFSYMKNQTSTTTPIPGIIANTSEIPAIISDVFDVELLEVTQDTTNSIILGKDKVTRFYICISIALVISILFAIIGVVGYFFYIKRRTVQEFELQQRNQERRRSQKRNSETSPLAH